MPAAVSPSCVVSFAAASIGCQLNVASSLIVNQPRSSSRCFAGSMPVASIAERSAAVRQHSPLPPIPPIRRRARGKCRRPLVSRIRTSSIVPAPPRKRIIPATGGPVCAPGTTSSCGATAATQRCSGVGLAKKSRAQVSARSFEIQSSSAVAAIKGSPPVCASGFHDGRISSPLSRQNSRFATQRT